MCFVGEEEAEEGRRLVPTVHCEMRAHQAHSQDFSGGGGSFKVWVDQIGGSGGSPPEKVWF